MNAMVHAGTGESNRRANRSAVDFSWRDLFRRLFPEKTAASVATFTRTGLRAAEYVVSGESEPSTRALVNLLRSPAGQRVLDAITAGVEWREAERRLIDIYELEQELQQLELKRRELAGVLAAPRR